MIELRPDSGVPIYLQLVAGVREQIAAGVFAEGHALPSLRALSAELRVNYHTVAKAYRLLEDGGAIARQRGGPYRVCAVEVDSAGEDLLRADVQELVRRARAVGIANDRLVELVRAALATTTRSEESA